DGNAEQGENERRVGKGDESRDHGDGERNEQKNSSWFHGRPLCLLLCLYDPAPGVAGPRVKTSASESWRRRHRIRRPTTYITRGTALAAAGAESFRRLP